MKNFILEFFLMIAFFCLCNQTCLGQKCQCNIVNNPTLTYTAFPGSTSWGATGSDYWYPLIPPAPGRSSSFPPQGYFPPWNRTQDDPHTWDINQGTPPSTPSAIELRYYRCFIPGLGMINLYSGMKQSICLVKPNRPYVFSIMVNNWRTYTDSNTLTIALASNVQMQPFQAVPQTVPPNNYQVILNIQGEGNNTFRQYVKTICFTPTLNWNTLWLFGSALVGSTPYYLSPESNFIVDDIELIPNFDYGVKDYTLCDTNQSVTIGDTCSNFLHLTPEYEWTIVPSSTIIDTSATITVSPNITTIYILKRTFREVPGCIGYDTMTVTISGMPTIDLGPDTSLCRPPNFILLSAGSNSGYSFKWYFNNGTIPNWYNANLNAHQSGKYVVIADSNGCITSDSINVTFYPKIDVKPDSIVIYDSTSGRLYKFQADTGYVSYLWSPGSKTTNYINVSRPGYYFCTVTDTNGCIGTDTSQLIYRLFTFDLGANDTLCQGQSYTIICPVDSHRVDSLFWSTGDTNSFSITVNATGVYRLTIIDTSGCIFTDSIYLKFLPLEQLFLHNDDTCEGGSFTLHQAEPKGGIYIYNNKAFPEGSIFPYYTPGTYSINYQYPGRIDTSCANTSSFHLIIHPNPNPQIDQIGPFCLNDPPAYKILRWQDQIDTFGIFYPDSAGNFIISHSVTDSNNMCEGWAYMNVQVEDTIHASIVKTELSCGQVELKVLINGQFDPTENYHYQWLHTKDSSNTINVYQSDTYTVVVYSYATKCPDTAKIYVDLGDGCTNVEKIPIPIDQSNNFLVSSNTTWNNEIFRLDHNLIVQTGVTLHIKHSTVYMRNCTKIIVERHAKLIIDTSCIGMCKWLGIEVWGSYDCCTDDTTLITCQGYLEMTGSVLSNADIGIFVGKRIGPLHDRAFSGGIIKVKYDTFENNFTDIMFSDWNVSGICFCPISNSPDGQYMQSRICFNYFGRLADTFFCDSFVSMTLNFYNNFYSTITIPNCETNFGILPLVRCHIIDLSPYTEVGYFIQPNLYEFNYCCKYISASARQNYTCDGSTNITFGNFYYEDKFPLKCGCRCLGQHSNYK